MSQLKQNQITDTKTEDSTWKSLYRVGGAAPLIALAFYLTQILTMIFGGAYPTTMEDWVSLLQRNKILGLLYLNALDIFSIALVGTMFLALYIALRRVNESYMAIAAFFAFIGVAAFVVPRVAMLSLLPLSDQYAAATTEAQRAMFLAAGEALLAIYNPGAIYQGAGIYLSLFLVLLAGLIISIVMLRSSIFSKATAYVGILANVFGLGYFIALAFAPAILALPPVISAPFRLIWYILIALRLFQLGRLEGKTLPKQS